MLPACIARKSDALVTCVLRFMAADVRNHSYETSDLKFYPFGKYATVTGYIYIRHR